MAAQSTWGSSKSFCPFHAKQESQNLDPTEVTQQILGPVKEFHSAFSINHALRNLFIATAQNRIPPKTAATLAYISQLILQTVDPLCDDIQRALQEPKMDHILQDVFKYFDTELKKGADKAIQIRLAESDGCESDAGNADETDANNESEETPNA
jgi:hypothetical protein